MVACLNERKASEQEERDGCRQRHVLHDYLSDIRTGNNGKRGSLNEWPYFDKTVYVAGFVERLAGGRASGCRVVEKLKRCDDDVISDRAA
jgi:hypothetical protein